jgi:hypothetical protein
MSRLLEIRDYLTVVLTFEWKPPWELVDGTQDRLNLEDPRSRVLARLRVNDLWHKTDTIFVSESQERCCAA